MKFKMMHGASLLLFSLSCAVLLMLMQVAPSASAHSLAATTGMVRFVHAAVGVPPVTAANGTTPAQGTIPTPAANGATPAQGTTTTPTTAQGVTPAIAMGVAGAPGPVDVFVDGQAVANQLAYGATSNYLSVAAGAHMVQFAPTGKGANAALIGQQVTVTAGGTQTVAAIGGTANAPLALKVFTDTNTMAAATTANVVPAQLHVYHLATTVGTITMNVNNNPVVINLMQGMASRYHALTPGSATLQVVAQQTNQTQPVMMVNQAGQAQPVTLNLQGGMIYSAFLVDMPTTLTTTTPATGTGTNTMPLMLAGTATSTATPGMPQTGSDPQLPTTTAMLPWKIVAMLLLLVSSGGGMMLLAHTRKKATR